MTRFYEADLTDNPDSPFVRDASNKLVRRSYWMDMTDKTLVADQLAQRGVRDPDVLCTMALKEFGLSDGSAQASYVHD